VVRLLPGRRRPEPTPAAPEPLSEHDAGVLAGAFGHGYLVHTGGPAALPGILAHWRVTQVGPVWLHTAPRTVVTVSRAHDRGRVVVLGHPIDTDSGTTDAASVVDGLLRSLVDSGVDAAVRRAAYLSGRWTVLLLHPASRTTTPGRGRQPRLGGLTVVPDTLASQPVYYAVGRRDATLASSDTLVAAARDISPSTRAPELMAEIKELRPQGVVYLPGETTLYEGVRQVVPNCLLRLDVDRPGQARHERFWPFEPRVEDSDLPRVTSDFSERLRAQIALMAHLGPLAWSLTGGLDSRVTLAHLADPPPPGTFTFTYFNPRDGVRSPGAAEDVFVANLLSYRLGLPHRVLRWRKAPEGSVFADLHRMTYPVSYASQGAAHAMWADLPHDIVQVQSNGGEIGTVHMRVRNTRPITPAKAASLWLGPAFSEHPTYLEIFASYLEYAQFTDERLLGYDHHDLMYWEHRMGRWGHRKFLDGDLSHRIMVPFNDRRVLETMHRLPEAQRVAKALYTAVLDAAPALQVEDPTP
jgi:hypothetical protein